MQERITFNRRFFFDAIKFVGAVLILFFGLKISAGDIGEDVNFLVGKYYDDIMPVDYEYNEDWTNELGMHNVSDVEQKEQVDTYNDLDGESHEYQLKFQTLCLSNFSLCFKIQFEGEITPKDQFMYFASTVYVFNTISKNLQIGGDINTQLKKITIDSAYGSTRGSADWDSISIKLGAVKSYVEFLGLISHEFGHIVDLGVIKGYSSEKDSKFTEFGRKVFAVDDPSLTYYSLSWSSETVRNADATKEDFCSGYGMTDPFEDFAECHNMYLNHNEIFKSWAKNNNVMKQKYNFFANLYGGKFMFASSADLTKPSSDISWRPWDSTKM